MYKTLQPLQGKDSRVFNPRVMVWDLQGKAACPSVSRKPADFPNAITRQGINPAWKRNHLNSASTARDLSNCGAQTPW